MFQCEVCSAVFKTRRSLNRFNIILFNVFVMYLSSGTWRGEHVWRHWGARSVQRCASPKKSSRVITARSQVLAMFARRLSKTQKAWRITSFLTMKRGTSNVTCVENASKGRRIWMFIWRLTQVKSLLLAVSVMQSLQPQVIWTATWMFTSMSGHSLVMFARWPSRLKAHFQSTSSSTI